MVREAYDTLVRLKAIIVNDHILYTSGKHGSEYVNKDALYPHTTDVSRLCSFVAEEFKNDGVDIVLAPALGGIVLTQWIANHLTLKTAKEVLAVYSEKLSDGSFVLKRGYGGLVRGKRVLVAEDVLNTGGSVKKVIDLVRAHGGDVVGLAALCNRGNVKPEDVSLPPRIFSLVDVDFKAWEPKDCPLCKKNQPISKEYGKGAKAEA